MSRLRVASSVFVFAVFVALGFGVSKAHAQPVACDGTVDCCMGYNCTVFCEAEAELSCNGDEGTDGDDVFCGSQLADTINAGEGDDIVCAGKGDDIVNAGDGHDDVSGGQGNDTLNGDDGDDTLDGGQGEDTVNGGNDDDDIFGGQGNDTLNGQDGDDYIEGGQGADDLNGGDQISQDECHGGPQNDDFDGCECGSEGPTRGPQSGGEDDDLNECV